MHGRNCVCGWSFHTAAHREHEGEREREAQKQHTMVCLPFLSWLARRRQWAEGARGVRPIVRWQRLRAARGAVPLCWDELIGPRCFALHACSNPPPSFSLSLCSYFHSLSLVFFSPPLWYSMFISLSPSVSFFPPSLFLSPLACCHVLCAVPAFLRESRERMMEGKADRQRKGSSESDWNTDACVFKFDVSWTAFPKRLGQTVSEIADKIWLDSLLLLYVFV